MKSDHFDIQAVIPERGTATTGQSVSRSKVEPGMHNPYRICLKMRMVFGATTRIFLGL